jgi:hypothetical protein
VACGDEASATSFQRESVDAATANPVMEGVDTSPPGQVLEEPVSDDLPTTTPTSGRRAQVRVGQLAVGRSKRVPEASTKD